MTVTATVTHAHVSAIPDDPTKDVSSAKWNADHTVVLDGLGSAAEADATDFATAAQGALADTAVQPAGLAGYAPLASPTFTGTPIISEALKLTGIISPTQIAANTNDYAPTGFATATVLRLNSDAARAITGLAGGASGRVIEICNVGSFDLLLANESASSTAGNRFAIRRGLILPPNRSCILWYDGTSSRWRLVGEPPRTVINVLSGSDVVNADATPDTLADVTGLSFAVIAGYTYRFRFSIVYDAAATTTGSRWTANGPAVTYLQGLVARWGLAAVSQSVHTGNGAWDGGVINATTPRLTGNWAEVFAVVTPSADGTVIGRFSSEITASAITVKGGGLSYVEYECIS